VGPWPREAGRTAAYLDYAATTPPRAEVLEAMARVEGELWANPSSAHADGRRARAAVEWARGELARVWGGEPFEWVFTSGGTEANNLALRGAAAVGRARGARHVVVSAVEHASVLDAARALAREGYEVAFVDPDPDGRVPAERMASALRPDTAVCSLMLGNNEVGALQPVREVAALCRARGVLVHCDAVAVAGRLPFRVGELGVDLLTVSAHKLYGPKGVGALYVREGLELEPLLYGGGQERRWRPGTEPVAAIVGFAVAARRAAEEVEEEAVRLAALGAELRQAVLGLGVGAVATGPADPQQRVPGLESFVFPGLDGEALLVRLDLEGIRVSRGAACSSGSVEPSHVLRAMGWPPEIAATALRVSLGRPSRREDVQAFVGALERAVRCQLAARRRAASA
jgi:cysteine desulfurase